MSFLQEAWAAVLTEGHKLDVELLNLRELLDKDLENLLARPKLVRGLFITLRNQKPILVAPGVSVVALYPDVVEVLDNEAAFSVVPIYSKKMEATTGDFVLGMDATPQYEREIALMRQAFHPADLERIREFAEEQAMELVEAAAGRIDVVAGLTRVVPTRLLGGYFGTPGPEEATTMVWMRAIFRHIFLNLSNDPNMAQEAITAAQALNAYLDTLIAQRKAEIAAEQETPDDFLCRLLHMQAVDPFADEVVRRILGGTIVGTVDTISKAVAQALDQLLDRPLTLAEAQEAARTGDDALLATYLFEALRFSPQNPILLRRCEQAVTIAAGTDRATLIPQGSLVIVTTEAAMFDPALFPEPDAFRIDRPQESYIHFGSGMHTCFGRHIAAVVIPAVAKQLLLRQALRRAEGPDGSLRYDGAFPDHLVVTYDA